MRIHVTAVSGTGMGALAGLLKAQGHDVSGSDTAFYPPMGPALERWGIELLVGFSGDHLRARLPLDAVIIGNVCRRDNPEAAAALELGVPRLHIADALGQFVLPGTSPLVVTGTHGKTTTSSLCAHLLDAAGLRPGFLIGGIPQGKDRSFQLPGARTLPTLGREMGRRNPPFVLEGDEYDTAFWEKSAKFLHYGAEVAILTSIEHDHIDIYPTFEDYRSAFVAFARGLPETGLLIACASDEQVRSVAAEARSEVVFYGIEGEDSGDAAVHYLAAPAQVTPQGTTFDLYAGGVLAGRYLCPTSGRHNLKNAVAALAAAAHGYGADLRSLAEPLTRFSGVKRRQEHLGSPGEIDVFDDFAHHPTAVRETLAGLRHLHPQGRLIAVFEPRSATACRKMHQTAYVSAFDSADLVALAPVGRPELDESEKLNTNQLARELTARGIEAQAMTNHTDIVTWLVDVSRKGDAIVLLSNGSFGGIHEQLLDRLQR